MTCLILETNDTYYFNLLWMNEMSRWGTLIYTITSMIIYNHVEIFLESSKNILNIESFDWKLKQESAVGIRLRNFFVYRIKFD